MEHRNCSLSIELRFTNPNTKINVTIFYDKPSKDFFDFLFDISTKFYDN
jgi:hypothetical protein